MKNIYYCPNDFGLIIVDELNESCMFYEYNTFIVLQHVESERIFFTQDSGCSCPTPFEVETFNGPNDNSLTEVTQISFNNFENSVNNFPVTMGERQECITKIKNILNNNN